MYTAFYKKETFRIKWQRGFNDLVKELESLIPFKPKLINNQKLSKPEIDLIQIYLD